MTDPDDGDAPDSTLVDPGDEPEAPAQRRTPVAEVLSAIAVGGVLGAEARYGLGVAIPHAAGQWPWATFLTNASGCLLIGVLMVVILELHAASARAPIAGGRRARRLHHLFHLQRGHPRPAAARSHRARPAYFVGTPMVALAAVASGVALARAVGRALHRRRARP